MSDTHTVHTTGLKPPSRYAWIMGATVASIDFVLEAQGLLAREGHFSDLELRQVTDAVDRVKAREVTFTQRFTVRDLLEHGLPEDTHTD